jgi:osmotically-inducible protein OsmY
LAHSHQRDQQILGELKTRFENDAGFPHVGFKCKFGRITLSGRAQYALEKVNAEKLANSIFGVIDVSNQIVVVAEKKTG